MAWTPPTNPEDSYELSVFGFGPFPLPGESVDVIPSHPTGGGYGGVGFVSTGGVGSPFGLGSYGSLSRPRINISGGYGGDPYGLSGYGGTERTPPFISSAISLNGYEVEVFFSEELDMTNPALTDPTSYTLETIMGAAPATVISVHVEQLGPNLGAGDTLDGATSVVLTHTGTTQGAIYEVHATGLTDIAGNPILDKDVPFFSKGDPPNVIATLPSPDTGDEVLITYSHDMLANVGGYGSLGGYDFAVSSTNPYPITPSAQSITVDSSKQVTVDLQGMTSILYDLTVGPAFAFSYDTTDGLVGCTRTDTGTGTVVAATSYLVVSRLKNNAFAMEWQDTSGVIVPLTSTLRADCTFDFSNAFYDPALSLFVAPEISDVVMQDGVPGNGVLVRFTLQQSLAGVDQIRIRSGTFDMVVDAAWSNASHVLSFVRNMQAGIVTFLLDEAPLMSTLTANVDGTPETQAGVRFSLLDGGWDISGVRVAGCLLSSSTTIYSAAWNFIHDQQSTFTGSAVLAQDRVLTQRGPLVKGWGDATPATVLDVEVRLSGTAVEVASVNPYIGEIVLTTPVPLLPVGTSDVAVDYQWFKSPVMELAGLNIEGLVLNKYDCPQRGHNDPAAHGDQVQVLPGQPDFLGSPGVPKGAVDIHRFPMGIVLGPMDRTEPLYIGHRYLGFERAYSALVNSPDTLLLNQAPGRVSVPGFEREVSGVSVAYEGLVTPVVASPAWALDGSDLGGVDHDGDTGLDLGTYTVIDPNVSSLGSGLAATSVYHRGVDLTFPSSVNLVGRFQLSNVLFDTDYSAPSSPPSSLVQTPQSDGVFTGVGFGIHDNRFLYFVGILRVNDVLHVGLLLDPKRLHEWESWEIGPAATLTATSQTTGTFVSGTMPVGFGVGSRFQRLEGTQEGVYTATAIATACDGTTTVTFAPALPAPWDIYGNKYTEVVFETNADEKPFTYQLDIDTDQQVAELRISGETRGVVATIDGNVPALPPTSETTLQLPFELVGQAFWGSLSRQAASRATWSFIRYGVVPDQVFLKGQVISNATDMTVLPEDNPLSEWWPTQTFGTADILAADILLLKATSTDASVAMSYGYARVEPFFIPDAIFDFTTKVQLDTTSSGRGVGFTLDDTQRGVELRTLLIKENISVDPIIYRGIVSLPEVSLAGLVSPEYMGWEVPAGSTLTGSHEGSQFVTRQMATNRGRWVNDIGWGVSSDLSTVHEDVGRVLEARLGVKSLTPNTNGDSGIIFGCQMTGTTTAYAVVQVEVAGASGSEVVRLRTATGVPVAEYTYDWADAPHTYRVLADRIADTVTLLIDDVVQAPAAAFTSFTGGVNNTQVFFGSTGRDSNDLHDVTIEAEVEWHSVHCHAQAPADLVRTLGVLKGVQEPIDRGDINNYELPRIDTSTTPNSWLTGPTIQWWDWRADLEVRAYRDPGWGVTILRPDLAMPPWYTAGDPATGPTAGWINVEYGSLPRTSGGQLGTIEWGSLDTDALTQSRWDYVNYRLSRHPTSDFIAPEHMVLNQYNVITSGERGRARTLETVAIQTLDKTRLTLLPTHLYADSIYKVIDGTTIWTEGYWTFNRDAQLITLLPDPLTGVAREFSALHANVTVMFIPGKPVTNTYLGGVGLLDGVTLLNEGTPPMPKSQVVDTSVYLLYDELEFIEVDNDGGSDLIAAICERGPGTGFSGLSEGEGEAVYSPDGTGAALGGCGHVADLFATGDKVGLSVGAEVFDFSGTQFWQDTSFLPQPDWQQHGGMPGGILFASGGTYTNPVVDSLGNITGELVAAGGTLGPGTAVLYPSFPARGATGGDQGRIYRRTEWFLDLRSVTVGAGSSAGSSGSSGTTDHPLDEDWPRDGWDRVPPTAPANFTYNPNGTSELLGSAFGQMSGAGDYSRYGPWGGLDSLTPSRDSATILLATVAVGDLLVLIDRVTPGIFVFTAAAVPVTNTEFAVAPNPHVALAAVINLHPVARLQYVATAGLTLSGHVMVVIEAIEPSTTAYPAVLYSTGGISITDAYPDPGSLFVMWGGSKIQQSSLVAGGEQTTDHTNAINPLLGMVVLGGSALPAGGEVNLIFASS